VKLLQQVDCLLNGASDRPTRTDLLTYFSYNVWLFVSILIHLNDVAWLLNDTKNVHSPKPQ